MTRALSMQTSTCNDLRAVTADITQRLGAIEQFGVSGGRSPTSRTTEEPRGSVEVQTSEEDSSRRVESSASSRDGPNNAATGAPHAAWSDATNTPNWSRVVKVGHRLKHVTGDTTTKPKPQRKPPREKKAGGIVGTSAGGNIRVIKTRLVSVFATKFSPTLDPETLVSYMKDKLGREVTCQKLDTVQTRFSSFKVTAECTEVAEMYDPNIWPEGVFVRRFYEARRPNVATVGSAPAGSVPVPEAGSSDAV